MVKKLKILRVIGRLNVGGAAFHVIDLASRLCPDRFESVLVSGMEHPSEGSLRDLAASRGVRVIVVPEIVSEANLRARDVVAIRRLYEVIRRERPHIVDTHLAKAGFVGRVAARLAGVPIVVHTFHGHVLYGYFNPVTSHLLRAMERTLARFTDCIVAVSEQVRRELVTYRIARPEKIAVVPLGLELEPLLRCRGQRGGFRHELGLDGEAPLVGIVGRICAIKNHRLFLDAAARVASRDPAARFVVVGDGALRSEVEQHARSLRIADRVIFTGWRRDLSRVYADLDVLAVSSDNEGTPLSVIEAMAAGCPVVATRVGGLRDLITDGETGRLVPPKDPEALSAAIQEFLLDRPRAARMGQTARALAQERFGIERLVSDTETLYEQLLARNASRVTADP